MQPAQAGFTPQVKRDGRRGKSTSNRLEFFSLLLSTTVFVTAATELYTSIFNKAEKRNIEEGSQESQNKLKAAKKKLEDFALAQIRDATKA